MNIFEKLFGSYGDDKQKKETSQPVTAPLSNKEDTTQPEEPTPSGGISVKDLISKSKFVAIDFETANNQLSSACSMGLAFSDGEKVIGTKHYYIKPIPAHFDPANIKIHGITPDMVEHAPSFYDIWDEIGIETLDIVAYNASFDANVLRESYLASGPHPYTTLIDCLSFYCTRDLARKAYSNIPSGKLIDVCSYLGINISNHHDACADAVAAAEIIHAMIKRSNMICLRYSPLYELEDAYDYRPKELGKIPRKETFNS